MFLVLIISILFLFYNTTIFGLGLCIFILKGPEFDKKKVTWKKNCLSNFNAIVTTRTYRNMFSYTSFKFALVLLKAVKTSTKKVFRAFNIENAGWLD